MTLGVFKPDQGYWTRMISSAAIGVIALAGAAWLWEELALINADRKEYIQMAGVIIFMGIIGLATYLVYWNRRTTCEFFIATEGEMKKVNWSTRKEIIGSTWVVIIVAVTIALILFTVDIIFKEIFQMAGVVYGESIVWKFFSGLGGG